MKSESAWWSVKQCFDWKLNGTQFLLLGGIAWIGGLVLVPGLGVAQVVADPSTGTIVGGCETGTCAITGGQAGQGNLFHSFEQLSWGADTRVVFQGNPQGAPVAHIFARVTGAFPSTIDGVLETTGNLSTADLFLLNPQGVIFGENARLDLGGSLIVSSGDRLEFENGLFFSARNLTFAPELLRVSLPVGLQYGDRVPRGVSVQGTGDHFTGDPATMTDVHPTGGLEVKPGQTLALLGGNILLTGAALQAPNGHLVLMGMGESGTVRLTPRSGEGWNFTPTHNPTPQAITFQGESLANGELDLLGSNLNLVEGSAILSQNSPTDPLGGLKLHLSDRLYLSDESLIRSETIPSGQGSPIQITAGQILLEEDAGLNSVNFSSGEAGSLTFNVAHSLEIVGKTPSVPPQTTQIRSSTYGSGDAAPIHIHSPLVLLRNGGVITSTTLSPGTGNAGRIDLQTNTVTITGVEPVSLLPSAIRSSSLTTGNANVVQIESDRVQVEAGGRITVLTANSGAAGQLRINARESILVQGVGFGANPSTISAGTNTLSPQVRELFGLPDIPSGNAGELRLTTPFLSVTQGGIITADNRGTGDSGSLLLHTHQLEVRDRGQISALTLTGKSGNIEITTQDLTLDQGLINASVLAGGNGGNINVQATGTIALAGVPGSSDLTAVVNTVDNGGDLLTRGTLYGIVTLSGGTGDGGSIDLQAQNLHLSSEVLLSTSSFATGNAGSVSLEIAETIVLDSGSLITTAFGSGNAGNISIQSDRLRLEREGFISGTSTLGNSGTLDIRATSALDIQGTGSNLPVFLAAELFTPEGDPALFNAFADQLRPLGITSFSSGNFAGNINIETDSLRLNGGALLLTSNFGEGQGGNVTLTAPTVVLRDAFVVTATTGQGNAGNISLQSHQVQLSGLASLGSFTTGTGNGGSIDVTASHQVLIEGSDLRDTVINGGFFADTQGDRGGNITVKTGQLYLSNNTQISSATSRGTAGDITLQFDRFSLDNSAVIANSGLGQGGDLTFLGTEWLILRNGSRISAAAGTEGQSGGNGGNIHIQSPLIVGIPNQNNDLIANAFQGVGGNIQLIGSGIYGFSVGNVNQPRQDPRNNVTASSNSGLSGNTTIDQEQSASQSFDLVPMPVTHLSETAIVIDFCRVNRDNSFLANLIRGIPPSARQAVSPSLLWDDRRRLSSPEYSPGSGSAPGSQTIASSAPSIVEAQGWYKTIAGEIILSQEALSPETIVFPPLPNCR